MRRQPLRQRPIVLVAQPHALHERRIVLDLAAAEIGVIRNVAHELVVRRRRRFIGPKPAIDFDGRPVGNRVDRHAAADRADANARPAAERVFRRAVATSSAWKSLDCLDDLRHRVDGVDAGIRSRGVSGPADRMASPAHLPLVGDDDIESSWFGDDGRIGRAGKNSHVHRRHVGSTCALQPGAGESALLVDCAGQDDRRATGRGMFAASAKARPASPPSILSRRTPRGHRRAPREVHRQTVRSSCPRQARCPDARPTGSARRRRAAAGWPSIKASRFSRPGCTGCRKHRPTVLVAELFKQVRQPAFAVNRPGHIATHRVDAGRLNQSLQRFDGIERHRDYHAVKYRGK